MNYSLIKDVPYLMENFESEHEKSGLYETEVNGFKNWIIKKFGHSYQTEEPEWEGKMVGRTTESVIASLIVHMNRFGKNYFNNHVIFLIVLKFGKNMTKMDLIKKNVHEKPAGMQIINRLITNGWVIQTDSESDKRSKVLHITQKGLIALETVMSKVRQATEIVSGNLSNDERIELIRLLNKLNDFHQPIYDKNIETENLLNEAYNYINN